jgi:hypothetical protein
MAGDTLSWGGRAMPKLSILYNDNTIEWVFNRTDNCKFNISMPPTKKVVNETESGLARRRIRDYRLNCIITFSRPKNPELVEFFRKAVEVGQGAFTPHPNEMFDPDSNVDKWEVLIISNFDFSHYKDKFIGHEGKVELIGKYTNKSLPVDKTGQIGGY